MTFANGQTALTGRHGIRVTDTTQHRLRLSVATVTTVFVVGCAGQATTGSSVATPTASPQTTPTPGNGLPGHDRIAFALEFGPTGDDCNIATIEPDGTGLQMLTNVTGSGCYEDPAWTPHGDRLFFNGGPGNSSHLFSIAPSGGPMRQLTFTAAAFDGDAAISPDGTHVAFDRSGGPNPPLPGIFLMNADGTHVVRLTTPPVHSVTGDSSPDFSPDGTKIAFDRDGAIYVIGVDGTGLREVTPSSLDLSRARWSPDGTKLLFGNPDTASPAIGRNVYVANADGSGLHAITSETEPNFAEGPAWSPDGTMIVFDRYHAGDAFIAFVVMHSDGSDPILVWHPPTATNNFPATATWGTAP